MNEGVSPLKCSSTYNYMRLSLNYAFRNLLSR